MTGRAKRTRGYAIKRSGGLWYCIDDRGRTVWDIADWARTVGTQQEMVGVRDSYAPSMRRKLRIVEVTP